MAFLHSGTHAQRWPWRWWRKWWGSGAAFRGGPSTGGGGPTLKVSNPGCRFPCRRPSRHRVKGRGIGAPTRPLDLNLRNRRLASRPRPLRLHPLPWRWLYELPVDAACSNVHSTYYPPARTQDNCKAPSQSISTAAHSNDSSAFGRPDFADEQAMLRIQIIISQYVKEYFGLFLNNLSFWNLISSNQIKSFFFRS